MPRAERGGEQGSSVGTHECSGLDVPSELKCTAWHSVEADGNAIFCDHVDSL